MTYLQSARAPDGVLFSWLDLQLFPTAGNEKQHAVAEFIDGNLPCLPAHLSHAVSSVGTFSTPSHSCTPNLQLPPLGQTTVSTRRGNLAALEVASRFQNFLLSVPGITFLDDNK